MRTYTLTQSAYGQDAGTVVALDDTDPLVQLNVDSGVLVEGESKPAQMTCPICLFNLKKPPRFSSGASLATHYSDKHAGFAVPAWAADTNEGKVN